ncbi:putative apyrase 6 [Nicotiana tabacum]|uniref:Apyrase 6 n=1 Tax=Nicotiana tabacum TaxID=4097 RepID=A0A1S4C6A0_TOBAC|nr:probable apyrase 6 [Nicotiana tomentosiformis]XP_016496648.1 PREDICTED: probable apyrase 6 isoform X1 [Nicotiana tabacum]
MRRSNARKKIKTTNGSQTMESVKFQARPSRSSHRSPNRTNSKSNLIYYTSIAFIIAFVCYVFVFSSKLRFSVKKKYGIVIDGGSTGTRIHVFEYEVRDGVGPVFDFGEKGLVSMRVNPGLSAYAEEPEMASESVAELVEFGKKSVPKEYWSETEIRLMATAGMRLLDLDVQEKILEVCRKVLRDSGFKFMNDWASVISGSDEGLYAWVIANYALGTLGSDPLQTTGIIELGGASAQVTFVSDEPMPHEYSRTIKFRNFTYKIYSHSLLQFGQNVAFDLLLESLVARGQDQAAQSVKLMDPCSPRGYTHNLRSLKLSPSSLADKNRFLSALYPSGNFSECRSASLSLLQKGKESCPYKSCYIGSTFMPKLQGKFLATENFFHTSKFFGLPPKAFLSDLMAAGKSFCEEDWSRLKSKYHSLQEEDLHRYCFSSAYILALLHDSLGIGLDDDRIGYANQVENIPLDWALGAFILQSTAESDKEHSGWFANMFSEDSLILLLFFAFFILVMFTAWYVSKWRKPQLKTVYDLEKGKYIVTRVGRCS